MRRGCSLWHGLMVLLLFLESGVAGSHHKYLQRMLTLQEAIHLALLQNK